MNKVQKKLVPELRFGEFRGDWKISKFGQISSKIGSGKTPRGGDKVYQRSGVSFIRSQNVINNKLNLDDTHISERTHMEMKSSKVISNDILLNITGGSIGRSCVVPSKFIDGNVNQHVCIIRLKKDNSKFIQSFLSSYRGKKLIYQGQTGSGREGLNFESIKSFKINLPKPKEQQKIANFLTAVDQRISLLKQKKAALESYKKGLMQKIFSQEIRFKPDSKSPLLRGDLGVCSTQDSENYPDWEEKKLGEVALKVGSGKTPRGGDKVYTNTGIPFIRSQNVIDNKLLLDEIHITQETHKEMSISKVVSNDILLNITGGSIGRSCVVPVSFKEGNVNQHVAIIRLKKDNSEFIQFFLSSHFGQKLIYQYQTGSGREGLNFESIKSFKIKFPVLKEQQKIADCLSSMDQSINKLKNQIEQTTQFKKGLLQRMFV